MSLRLNRAWLVLGLLLAGDVWALGLGDIRLSSALNEPLRAEIQLLSATPEELSNLKVQLASPATFERYGIDRPLYLTRLQFSVVGRGQGGAGTVRITSPEPMTEPFVTFLVEATWASGRLLREYTVLLDPPTFAPPPSGPSSQAVTAPTRPSQADSGRIERPAPAPQPAPADAGATDAAPFDTAGSDVYVQRGDTLWEIASRVRPDSRLSMNQIMVAIYEANPQAFEGNLNRLNAGATLRIPSADDIFSISRGDAMSEVQQQNAAWGGVDTGSADTQDRQPSLTLVPPDGEQPAYDGAASTSAPQGEDAGTAERIRELEETIAEQSSLIEIRDNELAALRDELARLRAAEGAATDEATVPPADQTAPGTAVDETDEAAVDDTDELFADDEDIAAEDDAAAGEEAEPLPATTPERTSPQVTASSDEPGIVDRIVDVLTGFWGILGIVLLLVLAILVWLAKRAAGRPEEDSTGVWEALDSDDDIDSESRASTERLRALARDDDSSIVVVEQETDRRRSRRDLTATAASRFDDDATGSHPTLEDTFSSETAINLDQSDPVAEADFHMAYGLYDQAADLINSALAVEPERTDLMAKLCEIYFVWGNRDAFIEAATRLHDQLGGETTPDWDKIVIMGQQIAGGHRLFSGASAAGAATRIVDLSLDSDAGAGALDIDFAGGPDGEVSDVIDLGGDEEEGASDDGLDFMFGEPERDTGATATREMHGRRHASDESTVESPTLESPMSEHTVESPTIEQPADDIDGTSELPSISESDDDVARFSGDATAEIDLADLGLDLDALAKSGLDADLGSEDEEAANTDFADVDDIDETSENRAFQPDLDTDATGRNAGLDDDEAEIPTGRHERFDLDDALGATSEIPALDEETGKNPALHDQDEQGRTDVDVDFDVSLLDATGQTQILSDFPVDPRESRRKPLRDDEKTMLSPAFDDDAETLLASFDDLDELDEEGGYAATAALSKKDIDADFDFAKTEALPKDAFGRRGASDETGEMPVGSMDVDLDLDDLTSALRFSEGDTVDQPRDDRTVEQPRIGSGGDHEFVDLDVGDPDEMADDAPTEALSPDELSDDLHDARTMTEVGTKLDLARAYVDMGDPDGARSILEEVLDEGDDGQRQQAQRLIDSLPA